MNAIDKQGIEEAKPLGADERWAEERLLNEWSLIGVLAQSASAFRLARSIIGPEDFADPLMARIFCAIEHNVGLALDGFRLTARLIVEFRQDEIIASMEMTGSALFAKLAAGRYPDIAVEGAARQVKHDKLNDELKAAVANGNTQDAEKCAADMSELVFGMYEGRDNQGTVEQVSDALVTKLNDTLMHGIVSEEYAYAGTATLARSIGGWRRKRLYILGGRPAMGKTTIALSWLLRTAGKGFGCLFFSLEMGKDELAERALTDMAWAPDVRVEYEVLTRQTINDAGMERICQASQKLKGLPLTIDDRAGLTLATIRATAEREQQRLQAMGKRLDVVAIDHMGLMRSSGKYQGMVQETEEISNGLKVLAKELDCAVLCLVQLNRAAESREEKRPTLADLRWSGAIEQDADCVMFCYREAYYLEHARHDDMEREDDRLQKLARVRNKLEIIVAKQRGGGTPTLEFFCDMACAVVRDAA